MKPERSAFTAAEWRVIQRLRTPEAVQRYLRAMPYNREVGGETLRTFRGALRAGTAHCLEAALTAAVILEQHGYAPRVLSLESVDLLDHVIFVFQEGGRWGSVARSRDFGLHGRRPVFRSVRDLARSYQEPYVDKTGRITGFALASLEGLGRYDWRFSTKNVWRVERFLIDYPHEALPMSDRAYARARGRYDAFKTRTPDRQPDYFPRQDRWW